MEVSIGKMKEVDSVSIDFFTEKMRIETDSSNTLKEILPEVEKRIKEIEGQVVLEEWEKESEEEDDKYEYLPLLAGGILFAIGLIFDIPSPYRLILFLAAYGFAGGEVLLTALGNIRKGQVFDENFLMSIATVGAFFVGEYPEAVAVMLFYQVGELFQDKAVDHSRKSISSLLELRPDYANLIRDGEVKQVLPETVRQGDIILIKPGERVPLDGEVIEGNSSLDTSAITGESLPRSVKEGSEILSGMINKNGLLKVKVLKVYKDSTIAKILDLVENAGSKKAPTEKFITKFARYYTPVVVFIALGLAVLPPLLLGEGFSEWIYRALIFLVVSCPCALVISIPLGFFGGIGGASKKGILIKGGNYLEALNNVTTIVFDKTGTLTKGNFIVTEIETYGKYSREELLKLAAMGESYSTHPIALSIIEANGPVDTRDTSEYQEIPGHGIKIKVDGKEILIGNRKLLTGEGIEAEDREIIGTVVYIAADGKAEGHIIISDEIKEDARKRWQVFEKKVLRT